MQRIQEYRANAEHWLAKATDAEHSDEATYYAHLADLNIKMAHLELELERHGV